MTKKIQKVIKNHSPVTLKITHVGSKGEGVAKLLTEFNYQKKEFNFFIPFALPNETITAKPIKILSENVRAQLIEIKNTSPERVDPKCQHFFKCGGCMLQHWNFKEYNHWKTNKITSRIHKLSLNSIVKPILTSGPNTRRHTKFTVKKNNNETVIGFNEYKSHYLVEINECIIIEKPFIKLMNEIKQPLDELLQIGETIHIHVNLLDHGIDMLIDGLNNIDYKKFSSLNQVLMQNKVIRFCRRLNNKILDLIYVTEKTSLSNKLFSSVIFPNPGGFLQATLSGENAILKSVFDALEHCNRNDIICELFCGCGTITLPLLLKNFKINAFELNQEALNSIHLALKGKSFKNNFKMYSRNLKSNPLSTEELNQFGAVIIDPPRSGAFSQFFNIGKSKVPTVVNISCNIDTFIRDSKLLIENNYKLKWIQPIDQFLYSSHIEVVGLFKLEK